jgi:transcription elongation factor GreA
MEKTYLTKEKYKELKESLKRLKNEERQKIAKRLKEAKELGDLSENSEYQEAKNDKILLDQKINKLEEILRNSEIIKKSDSRKVQIGSEVEIEEDKKKKVYTIVGSSETDPSKGKISNESPFGKKLLGCEVGDKVVFETSKNKRVFKIKKIS